METCFLDEKLSVRHHIWARRTPSCINMIRETFCLAPSLLSSVIISEIASSFASRNDRYYNWNPFQRFYFIWSFWRGYECRCVLNRTTVLLYPQFCARRELWCLIHDECRAVSPYPCSEIICFSEQGPFQSSYPMIWFLKRVRYWVCPKKDESTNVPSPFR